MAKGKKSVVVYCDWIHVFEKLEDEEAGKLIKHMFRYINDKNPEPPDRLTELVFEPLKQQLKRDLKEWEDIRKKRAEAGRIGGKASGETRRNTKQNETNEVSVSNAKYHETNEANEASTSNTKYEEANETNEANASNTKHDEANEANALNAKHDEANEAVTVTVTVNDTVTVNEYKEVVELWNTMCCPPLLKVKKITPARKKKIKNRITEMGGRDPAMDTIKQIFEKVNKSDFLKGDNPRSWQVTFDWIFENNTNWVKIIEGNYDNKKINGFDPKNPNSQPKKWEVF